MRGQASERGFSLVEMLIATVIAGMLFTAVAQMIRVWAKGKVVAIQKERRRQVEADLRRLEQKVRLNGSRMKGYSSAGPWPVVIPGKSPVPWERPAPGFEELKWAPSSSPVYLQYHVDGWATGFMVNAIGDIDKNGSLELYRIWGDVGMFEGPLPYPPSSGP